MTTEYDHSRYAHRSFWTRVQPITKPKQNEGAETPVPRDKGRVGIRFRLASRGSSMRQFLIASLFVPVFAAPAFAKPGGFYPVSCDNLWAAVKTTLDNPSNYGIQSLDDARLRASFVIVGSISHYTQRVALSAEGGGCLADATILEIGPDNTEWRLFQHRLAKSVSKLQAEKPKAEAAANGSQ